MALAIKNTEIIINKIGFDTPGKIGIVLKDGRELTVPLRYFPEIKNLSVSDRKKYTIVDDRTIFFKSLSSIYHIEDFMGLEENWRNR